MGNAEITAALAIWEKADKEMRTAVAYELECRALLTSLAFPSPTEGTNNAPLPDGRVLKGMFTNRYELGAADKVHEVEKQLPPALRSQLFKWSADIRVGAYKALEPAHKRLVNEVLTIKPGRPRLEIEEPKVR